MSQFYTSKEISEAKPYTSRTSSCRDIYKPKDMQEFLQLMHNLKINTLCCTIIPHIDDIIQMRFTIYGVEEEITNEKLKLFNFDQQLCSTFGQQPCSTFGQQPCSTFGQQPCSTFGKEVCSKFGQGKGTKNTAERYVRERIEGTNEVKIFGRMNADEISTQYINQLYIDLSFVKKRSDIDYIINYFNSQEILYECIYLLDGLTWARFESFIRGEITILNYNLSFYCKDITNLKALDCLIDNLIFPNVLRCIVMSYIYPENVEYILMALFNNGKLKNAINAFWNYFWIAREFNSKLPIKIFKDECNASI